MNLGNFGFSEAIAFVALMVAFYYGWQNSKLTKQLLAKEAGEAEAKSRADLGANSLMATQIPPSMATSNSPT